MGTWGPGIFSDDTACDVRGAYRMALEDGLDDQAAQQQVLHQFAEVLHDDTWNDGPLVWLALAKTQWQFGRLDDHVKAEALAVIDQGRDLVFWEGSDLYGYRRAALRRLRQKLTTAPPPRKQIRPPRHVDPEVVRRRLPYQEGSVFQLPLRDGRSARGLVSRLNPGSGLIIAYFFGPAAEQPWMRQPAHTALQLPPRPEHIARCPDDSLRRRRWPVLGQLQPAAWASWPPPPYDQPPNMSSFRRYQLRDAAAPRGGDVQVAEHDPDQVPALGRTLLARGGGARPDPARREGGPQGIPQPVSSGTRPPARQR